MSNRAGDTFCEHGGLGDRHLRVHACLLSLGRTFGTQFGFRYGASRPLLPKYNRSDWNEQRGGRKFWRSLELVEGESWAHVETGVWGRAPRSLGACTSSTILDASCPTCRRYVKPCWRHFWEHGGLETVICVHACLVSRSHVWRTVWVWYGASRPLLPTSV
jgi:hypothetical protein